MSEPSLASVRRNLWTGQPATRSVSLRYGVAIACVAAAWAVRTALTPAIGPTALPFSPFFPAVVWAAFYGGLGPALVCMVLSAFTANWFFIEPLHTFQLADPLAFLAFPIASGFTIVAVELMHHARRDLSRSRDTLSTTLASIGDGVIVTDAEGRVAFLNAEAERLTGWTAADARGKPLPEVFRIVNERTRKVVENPVAKVLREGTVVGLANHTVLIARDGSESPIDDSAAPVRQPGQPVIGVVLVFRDVRAQRLAQATQARLAAIVETSADAILSKALDGTILSWNAAAHRLFGYRADEIVGQRVTKLVPPELQGEELAILEKLRGGHACELLETTRLAKDGRRIPVAVRVSPLRDDEGKVVGASKAISDITSLVAARAALAREKELLVTTLASIGDAVIATDVEGRVTFLNPIAEQLTGWSAADALGRPLTEVFEIVNEDTRRPVENPALRAAQEGRIVGLANHTVLIARDGREIPIDDSAAPIRDQQGAIVGAVLVFRDVSSRRDVERSLRVAEERMRSVVEHVVDGIVTIDGSGSIESFNHAAERLFGYSAAEVIGSNVNRLMPEPYVSEHDGYLRNYLATGEAKIIGIGRDVVGRRKDGSTFPMSLAVSEFEIQGRRRFTGIVRDITERNRLERELRDRVAQLDEVNNRKSEFLATLAHELRNPLAPIRNSITLLQLKGPLDKELSAARDVIDRQVRLLTRLIEDLLDINRLGRHKLELRKQPVTLRTVVDSAVETARPAIEHGAHHLRVELPAEPIVLEADPARLAQVLANLLNNAAKYTDSGGSISLRAVCDGGEIVVTVKDNGIGIEPESLDRMFDMFTQAPHAAAHAQGGIGIGLALAKSLVELHGGTVAARSEGLGRGSTFVVRLPVASGAPGGPRSTPSPVARTVPACRILIVDDLRDNADSLATMMRALGHDVHVVYDGERAIAVAGEVRPDVVLMDIGMPGLNGYDACRRIRQQPWGKDMYVIAQTGWGQESDRRQAEEAGFDQHMLKPVDCAALMDVFALLPRSPRTS